MNEYAETVGIEWGLKLGYAMRQGLTAEHEARLRNIAEPVALLAKVAAVSREPDYPWLETCATKVTEEDVQQAMIFVAAMERLGIEFDLPAQIFGFQPSSLAVRLDRLLAERRAR